MTLAVFALYLVATIAIGVWSALRSRGTQADYFLGDRSVSPLAMALSAVSSGRSAWLVLGASGAAWSVGYSAIWLFPGYIVAELLMFVTLGPRLRRRSEEAGAITVPEVLERLPLGPDGRAGSSRLPIRSVAGLVTVLFLLTYVSANLVGGGKTLSAIFEVDGSTTGLWITAAIVLVYTVLGGYRAVVLTDVVQALFMLAGVLILPVLALVHLGGAGELSTRLAAIDPALTLWNPDTATTVGWLAIGLGSFGNPHILVRHMSLRDPREARAAAWMGTSWNVLMAAGAFAMGLAGRALYPELTDLPVADPEYLFATLGQDLSAQYLFAGFAGFLLAALFAAIMSTCDSQLLVLASSFVRDFRRRDAAEVEGLWTSRLAVTLTLVVAVTLYYGESKVVLDFVLLSWGALGAAFGPPLLLLLYDRRTTARGVLAGVVTGALVVWIWGTTPALKAELYELIPGFAASALATWSLRARR